MQYVEVQYAVDVHQYVAATRHLDIPRAAVAHCRENLGEFILSLNRYTKLVNYLILEILSWSTTIIAANPLNRPRASS